MKATFVLPSVHAMVSAFLIFRPLGGAGHGPGGEVFFYISLPAGFLSIAAQDLFKSEVLSVLCCFFGGVSQYALLGYLIDRITRRKKLRE